MSTEEGGTSQTEEINIEIHETEEKGQSETERSDASESKHTEKDVGMEPLKKKKKGLGPWTITLYIFAIVMIVGATASTTLAVVYYEIVQRDIRKEKPHETRDSISVAVCVLIALLPHTIWVRRLIHVLKSKKFKTWWSEKVERWWQEMFTRSKDKQVIKWMIHLSLLVQQGGEWLRSSWLVETVARWLFSLWKGAWYCLFSLGLLEKCWIWLITSLFLVGSVVISTPAKHGMNVFASLVGLLASTILCQAVVIDKKDYGMFEMILALVLTQFRNVYPHNVFRNLFGIAVLSYVLRDVPMAWMKKLKKLSDKENSDQEKTEEGKEPKEGDDHENTGKEVENREKPDEKKTGKEVENRENLDEKKTGNEVEDRENLDEKKTGNEVEDRENLDEKKTGNEVENRENLDEKKTGKGVENREKLDEKKTGKSDIGDLMHLLDVLEEKLIEKHGNKTVTEFHELQAMRSIMNGIIETEKSEA